MSSDTKRILMFVDHRLRDLPDAALLKFLLEQRHGHRVKLLNRLTERHQAVLDYRPHAVVIPHMWRERWITFARNLHRLGVSVVVLPTEDLASREQIDYMYKGRGFSPDPTAVDLHFFWNTHNRDWMVERGALESERAVVIGAPRFDFYLDRRLSKTFTREGVISKYGLNPEYPIVTWASSQFGSSFLTDRGTVDDFLPVDRETALTRVSQEHSAGRDRIATDLVDRNRCLSWIAELVRACPRVNFIFKVHPFEPDTTYARFLEYHHLKNVCIIDDEYIWPLLFATDLHIHPWSSTAVEAWLLHKPTLFIPLDHPIPTIQNRDLLDTYEAAGSAQELIARTEYYLGGGRVAPELAARRKEFLVKQYYRLDGKATVRAADEIDRLVVGHSRKSRLARELQFLRQRGWSLATSTGSKLLRPNRPRDGRAERYNRPWRDKRLITDRDVEEWSDLIGKALANGATS